MEAMTAKYTYYYRPGYGFENLLIEFLTGINRPEDHVPFIADLLDALSSLDAKVDDMEDVFVNDEYWFTISTTLGEVLLTINIWDMAFIIADNNQQALDEINSLLQKDGKFERVTFDFEKYR
jgi:hypothetical protein